MHRSLLPALMLALFTHVSFAAVNLNSANTDELEAINGVGPATAKAIVDYRTQHGAFKSVDELKTIKGFGSKRFEKLKPEFTVSAAGKAPPPAATPKAGTRPAVASTGSIKGAK